MSRTADAQYEVTLHYITNTAKALCVCEDPDCGDEVWLPIYDRDGNEQVAFERLKNGLVRVYAPESLLTEKGLV